MGNYFEGRKQTISEHIDDIVDVAEAEGYHRGYDEAWDEARDKGFDEGFNEGLQQGAVAIIEEITTELIPATDFFPTPETQKQYEAMLEEYKDLGAMCVAITINWLNVKIKAMDDRHPDA